ncbi:hypothetical protein MUN81_04220 [Hymenobacter sp. 5317J-9]|uniref:hypothetical protein n=1 Tax=Hymenobacter sp. 5317J-9 TaxID=2932250 RepID=UPI001FD63373|nr:hypothetical protein [Hymenobacter sp. 5317J-9]UOQ98700.1 hypothetical protein MUN81_04220 [Hymenobacter sp. 5317J-9]
MLSKAYLFAVLFSCAGGLLSAYGQTKANQVYSDPDEMRPLVPSAVAQAANHALSSAERVTLCRKGRGFIEFRFQVDGNGRIEDITGVRLYKAAREVPMPLLAKMKERVRQDVVFHVPVVDKPSAMSRWRRPSYTIPLTVFCR